MKTLMISLKIFLFFTILTGVVYPLVVTGIAQLVFPAKANGSLILSGGRVIGSELIGQQFNSLVYFTSRPSAVSYYPLPSGGSNLGLTNVKLKKFADSCRTRFLEFNHLDSLTLIPAEMIFASASGLDPHISPAAALLMAERVAMARNFSKTQKLQLEKCIHQLTEPPQFLFLGEERINVLLLNLATDKIK
ncbi:MAG: potassium-transporting ATPase subunit KdpC [Bacteroidota bacterium]